MTAELTPIGQENQKPKVVHQSGGSSPVYGIGMIGAWVFYIGQASTTQQRVQGFFKGLVWPAFLVYDLLKFLNKE